MTLGHDRSDTGLAVTGVVRNPETAAGVTDVQADVRVFDAAGLLITSRQALIAMPTFAAGALAISIGMVNGLTRRYPLSRWASQLFSSECRPPMPLASETINR